MAVLLVFFIMLNIMASVNCTHTHTHTHAHTHSIIPHTHSHTHTHTHTHTHSHSHTNRKHTSHNLRVNTFIHITIKRLCFHLIRNEILNLISVMIRKWYAYYINRHWIQFRSYFSQTWRLPFPSSWGLWCVSFSSCWTSWSLWSTSQHSPEGHCVRVRSICVCMVVDTERDNLTINDISEILIHFDVCSFGWKMTSSIGGFMICELTLHMYSYLSNYLLPVEL